MNSEKTTIPRVNFDNPDDISWHNVFLSNGRKSDFPSTNPNTEGCALHVDMDIHVSRLHGRPRRDLIVTKPSKTLYGRRSNSEIAEEWIAATKSLSKGCPEFVNTASNTHQSRGKRASPFLKKSSRSIFFKKAHNQKYLKECIIHKYILSAEHIMEYELLNDGRKDALRHELQKCFDLAQRLDAFNPTLPGAFTGSISDRLERQLRACEAPGFTDDGTEPEQHGNVKNSLRKLVKTENGWIDESKNWFVQRNGRKYSVTHIPTGKTQSCTGINTLSDAARIMDTAFLDNPGYFR